MVLADRLVVVSDDVRTTEVERRALLDRVARSGARVVVVSAPAGAGKSTLLRQWSDSDPRPHAVVALTVRHDPPSTLAEALLDALSALGPDEPAARAALSAEEPAYSSVVVPGMTELAASRARPYVLVLEDLHLLTDARAQTLVRAVADGVPAGSALVVSTRAAAPSWVAKQVAADRALVLSGSDLAFDAREAVELAERFGLSGTDAAELLARTEGWAVALHLAALAHGGTEASRPRPAGIDAVHDYLRSEVLDLMGAEQRELLMRTSVVEAPSAALCDRLLGRDDSARLLLDVVRRTSMVRESDGVFRCHHLLLDTLREDLLATAGADEIAALHRTAAHWYVEHGDPEAAVDHALLGGDLDVVAHVVGRAVPESAGSGRSDRLSRLLGRLTEEQIGSDPWLCLASAWSCLQRGDVDGRERWTIRAEAHAGRDWRARVRTDSYAASLAVLLAMTGRDGIVETARLLEQSLDGLGPDDPFRCPAAFLLGVSRTLLEQPGVADALDDSLRWARALDVPVNAADSLAFQGMLALRRGDVATGIGLIDEAAAVVAEHRAERLSTAAHPLSAYALSLAIQRRPDEAALVLAQARRLTAELRGLVPWFHVMAPLIQGRAALLIGDVALARQLTAEARQAITPDLERTTLPASLAENEDLLIGAIAAPGAGSASLTPAELRVLAYLPSHLTFPQIGEHLFLSASTVKTHALAIYRKLGVASRHEAVSAARRLGLVEAPLRG